MVRSHWVHGSRHFSWKDDVMRAFLAFLSIEEEKEKVCTVVSELV